MTVARDEEPTFGINTVARMTGVPVDTIRMWERRYEAVVPQRTSDNKRRYTTTDVARLRICKNLVDRGHSIGSVARLPMEALHEHLQVHAEMDDTSGLALHEAASKPGVLVYGDELPFQVQGWSAALTHLNISGTHTLYAEFEHDALNHQPDVLLIQYPSLQRDMEARFRDLLHRTTAQRIVLVYTYASTTVIDRLNRQGIVTLRTPVTPEILQEACQLQVGSNRDMPTRPGFPSGEPVLPRRYNGENLARVMQLANRVRCECPQHMVDLIQRLGAFEAYSADCENRNSEDALLHSHLNRMAGQARSLVEDALERWLQIENIQLVGSGEEDED